MKNKVLIIIFSCLLVFGGVIFFIGLSLGGQTFATISLNGVTFNNTNPEIITQTFNEQTKNLKIDIDFATNVSIVTGETFSIEYDSAEYKVTSENQTIAISQINSFALNKLNFNLGLNSFKNTCDINITIPKNTTLQMLDLNLSTVNTIKVENINADNLTFKTDVGNINIDNCKFNNLDLAIDVGNIKLNNCTIKNDTKAKINIGDIKFENTIINNKNDYSTNIGNIELNLIGNQEDYTIKSNLNVGKFKLGGLKADTNYTFGSGKKELLVYIDVGNCEIKFE